MVRINYGMNMKPKGHKSTLLTVNVAILINLSPHTSLANLFLILSTRSSFSIRFRNVFTSGFLVSNLVYIGIALPDSDLSSRTFKLKSVRLSDFLGLAVSLKHFRCEDTDCFAYWLVTVSLNKTVNRKTSCLSYLVSSFSLIARRYVKPNLLTASSTFPQVCWDPETICKLRGLSTSFSSNFWIDGKYFSVCIRFP